MIVSNLWVQHLSLEELINIHIKLEKSLFLPWSLCDSAFTGSLDLDVAGIFSVSGPISVKLKQICKIFKRTSYNLLFSGCLHICIMKPI